MDVRMVTQIAGPGLEDGGDAQFGAEIFGLAGEVLDGPGTFLEECAIPGFHGGANGFTELFGQGEGDEEINDGQEPEALLGQPSGRVVLTAAGTSAMIARVIGIVFPATGAAVALPAQRRGATAPDGPDCGVLFGRDEPPELRHIIRPVGRQNIGQPHVTAWCKRSSAARVLASLSGVR